MEQMGQELIRFCDTVEPHGLVDYQLGIWEEEILDSKKAPSTIYYESRFQATYFETNPDRCCHHLAVIGQCLDLLEP